MYRHIVFCLIVISIGCREEEERTGTSPGGTYTIGQLQDYGDPEHPETETTIKIRSVVITAVDGFDEDGSGRIGSVWIGDVDDTGRAVCGKWCGITIYNPNVVPTGKKLNVGDIVDVTGLYAEYLYDDDGAPPDPANPLDYHFEHLSEIYQATIYKTGEWLPVASVEVDVRDIQMEPVGLQARESAEAYEGVLVTVRNLTADSEYDSYGQFTTIEGVMIENDLFHYPCRGFSGTIMGTRFDSITGVVTWFGINNAFGNYKILPRGPEDFSPVPDFGECN